MSQKFSFTSKRFKKKEYKPRQPDYSNVIKLGKKYFTLTGWLQDLSSDINYQLEEITQERIKKDKYVRSAYFAYLDQEKKKRG